MIVCEERFKNWNVDEKLLNLFMEDLNAIIAKLMAQQEEICSMQKVTMKQAEGITALELKVEDLQDSIRKQLFQRTLICLIQNTYLKTKWRHADSYYS